MLGGLVTGLLSEACSLDLRADMGRGSLPPGILEGTVTGSSIDMLVLEVELVLSAC